MGLPIMNILVRFHIFFICAIIVLLLSSILYLFFCTVDGSNFFYFSTQIPISYDICFYVLTLADSAGVLIYVYYVDGTLMDQSTEMPDDIDRS